MKLIHGWGGSGTGYYPYSQKPVDYQPYRPIFTYRGPPPDAGFSYGLFEDEEMNEQYFSEQGLEPFSPLSGKPAKLLQEVTFEEMKRQLNENVNEDCLETIDCKFCGAEYCQNFKKHMRGREEFYCHRCGGKL